LRQEITTEAKIIIDALLRIWFTDENALIRQKVDAARIERLTPLLTQIVRQGIREAGFA
jgi:TetR/AcrR family transcriptional repressor of nem operon